MRNPPNNLRSHRDLEAKEYQFFLERVVNFLRLPYFWFFAFLTAVFEVLRISIDYVTIVLRLGLSTDELVVYWIDRWTLFLWPICMLLMYFSMMYLRDYTLDALKKIRFRLTEYPIYGLDRVCCGRIQHLIPIGFIIICVSNFAYTWFFQVSSTLGSISVVPAEMSLKFFFTVIWITYGWSIGGYLSWTCVGVIIICYTTSKRVKHISVFNSDRAGGFSVMGSLAMKSAVLYILSVSLMLPGWVLSPDTSQGLYSLFLLSCVLISLGIIEFALFLLPMTFFHSKMKKAKKESLAKLDSKIASFYSYLIENARAHKGDSREIEGILALRKIAESMYEYPFNLQMLAKVGSSAILPLLIVVIQRIAEGIG